MTDQNECKQVQILKHLPSYCINELRGFQPVRELIEQNNPIYFVQSRAIKPL